MKPLVVEEKSTGSTFVSMPRRLAAAQVAVAVCLYVLFVTIGFFPDSLRLFQRWPAWFEDPSNCYRIWWFSQIIYGGQEGTIWFMPDILWPYGIRTVQASNGLLKELIAALLGGGLAPWLAGNIIVLSTPVTVGLCAFLALRRLLHGAFLPSLAGGWMTAWAGYFTGGHVYPWVASTEGLIIFLLGLLLLRRKATWRRAALTGVAAGAAVWLNAQMLVYIAGIGLVFLVDRAIKRDGRGIGMFFAAGGIGFLLALPLLLQIWFGYGGDLQAMAGKTAAEDYYIFSNRLLTPFTPPEFHPHYRPDVQREVLLPNMFGLLTMWVNEKLMLPLHTDRSSYLGWITLALALIGWRSKRNGTGFLAVCALFFLLLSYGPIITLHGMDSNEPAQTSRGPLWFILGPFAFLRDLPIFSSMRTPMRLILVTQVCLGLLAGFGILRILTIPFLRARRWLRSGAVAIIIGLHFFDMNTGTVLFPPQYTTFWEKMAADEEDYTVLDIPYARGAHQYMHYAAYHQKRIPWGFGSRVPSEKLGQLERDLYWAMVASGLPHTWPHDHDRFAQHLLLYNVRYLVLHEMHLNYNYQAMQMRGLLIDWIESPRTWSWQPFIETPRLVHRDEVARIYEVVPREGADPLFDATISERAAYLRRRLGLTDVRPGAPIGQ